MYQASSRRAISMPMAANSAAGPGVAAPHRRVGHVAVQRGQAGRQQEEFEDIEQHLHRPGHGGNQPARCRDHIGADAQAGAQQQRPQRHDRPVDQHPLAERPRPLDAPDAVERAVDGQHQRQRRDEQHPQADRAQPAGLARELRQVAQHLPGDRVRDQALHQPGLQGALQLAEHRKRREHRQRHREERHQRHRGGEGEAAGRQAQPVLAEPLAQRHGRGSSTESAVRSASSWRASIGRYDAIAHAPIRFRCPKRTPATGSPSPAGWPWAACWALIVLGLAWELWLAPLRPGGSWLVVKVLPLCLPLAGLLRNRMYTYRWVSLMVWIYFIEGAVRAYSDRGLSARLAAGRSRAVPRRCSRPACCT